LKHLIIAGEVQQHEEKTNISQQQSEQQTTNNKQQTTQNKTKQTDNKQTHFLTRHAPSRKNLI
jgi:hypothetical protein